MICVSIARGRHRYMMAEHRHLVEQGAELVELRLDFIRRAVNLKRLLNNRPSPVIATCRRERDHGKWTKSERERLMLLRAAIADGADYVDLEEDIADQIPRYGQTKRIISYHNFEETPDDLLGLANRLASLDADIVKIATMAHDPHDNIRMLDMVKRAPVPTVGICMGELGTPTRLLTGRYGAPFSYATFHSERTLAPGQLSFHEMKEVYDYDRIGPRTSLYGVIADPIGHSYSPRIHNAAFRAAGIDAAYLPFRVPRHFLSSFFDDVPELGIRGLSVTIPHKEAVLRLLTKVDKAADKIGAVNTVVFQDDGQIVGYNTDQKAAMASLMATPGLKGREAPLEGQQALVLGAGGVARAIVYGLVRHGARVTIASRTFARAEDLAEQFNAKAVTWAERYGRRWDIVINGTPIGMHPNVEETPYEKQYLRRGMIVFDTVYNPENTLLVKEARAKECRVVTGIDMFVRQAALQFKLFTGQDAPRDVMRDEMRQATSPARRRSVG